MTVIRPFLFELFPYKCYCKQERDITYCKVKTYYVREVINHIDLESRI